MTNIAILHGTLTHLLAQSSGARAHGLDVRVAATDKNQFRKGLAQHRIDALVIGLDRLDERPLAEINRLQKYTRPRVTIVTHNFTDRETERALEQRPDLIIVREPLTRARLQGLLARILGDPELVETAAGAQSQEEGAEMGSTFDELIEREIPRQRYDDVQLNRIFEEAIALDYQFTQHVADLLIQIHGFESYCHRRNAGRRNERGLHIDVERGTAHSRALLEECLHRLVSATRIDPGPPADNPDGPSQTASGGHASAKVRPIAGDG
jgi:DNA-binding NarL/FixJ family response regulator